MNHSPRKPGAVFRRDSTRRLQQRIPTAFGGGGAPSSVTNSAPRNTPSYREPGTSVFERCSPRAPPARDPLTMQSNSTRSADVLPRRSSTSTISSRGSHNNSNESQVRELVQVIRDDFSQSSSRRGRVDRFNDDDGYYFYQDAMIEPMPSPARKQHNLRDMTSGAYGANVYEQEDSIIEAMPMNLKAPPSSSCRPAESYEEALARKMAAFEKPAAKKPKAAPSPPPPPPASMSENVLSTNMIEIAPGMVARLRGAQETFDCIANDFYMPTTCFCCENNLFCIMDADYVLCPVCKVVSPVGENGTLDGGVGLGFTFEDLQHYQAEIMRSRNG